MRMTDIVPDDPTLGDMQRALFSLREENKALAAKLGEIERVWSQRGLLNDWHDAMDRAIRTLDSARESAP
jgi:hypothetical protein